MLQAFPATFPDWFRDRIFSPEEALRRTVKSGTTVVTGFATSEPQSFYAPLWDFIRRERITDLDFRGGLLLTPHPLFVGSALKRKGLMNRMAGGFSFSLLNEWTRRVNQATRRVESLASLVAHYKRLQKRRIRFTSGFLSPALNGIIPDEPLTRMLYPEYVGRNTSRMGLTDMQFTHFADAASSLAFDVEGRFKCDLYVVTLTPPNADGEMSLGPSNAINGEILEQLLVSREGNVLVYLNPHYPFVRGWGDARNTFRIEEFQGLAEAGRLFVVADDGPIPALPAGSFQKPLPTESTIARHVVNHIEAHPQLTHGRAVQVGFGGTGVLAIQGLRESSWTGRAYTEMLEPFLYGLYEAGKIAGSHFIERDGRRTQLDGKIVCTFTLGEQGGDFYRKLHENPAIVLAPVSRVVVPEGFYGGMGINNCLAIDFNGHVNTSARDRNHYSGVGGGATILRGLARGGISYLCMKSTHTTPEGEVRSSVFPFMPRGTPVCYTGPDMCGAREGAQSFLVTEHGVAPLTGKTQSEFIRSLISVAHPDFRPWLKRAAWREYRVKA